MGNSINLPNITPQDVAACTFGQTHVKHKSSAFDTKNYLNVRLSPDETSREIVIRIIGISADDPRPFVQTHFHNVSVDEKIFKTKKKNFLCLSKNPQIDHEKFGYACPYCELNKLAYDKAQMETDELKKRDLINLSVSCIARECAIIRCIERGNEADGPKFWKITLSNRQDDAYHQIKDLYETYLKSNLNIFDLYNGYDIRIKITRNSQNNQDKFTKAILSVVPAPSPLSTDERKMAEWVYDTKKWTDVFTPKPYEYLKLVSLGKEPWKDKESGKWIDKAEFEARKSAGVAEADKKINEANNAVFQYAQQNAFNGGQFVPSNPYQNEAANSWAQMQSNQGFTYTENPQPSQPNQNYQNGYGQQNYGQAGQMGNIPR